MIRVILVMIGTIVIMFLTSWLLDWPFIGGHWIREALIGMIMVLEALIGYAIIREVLNFSKNDNRSNQGG